MKQPDAIIELHLPQVAKQSLWITLGSLLFLIVVDYMLYGTWIFSFSWSGLFLTVIGYIVLIALHEFFHLLGFRLFGGVPWKKMQFGLNLELGVAYATMDQLLTNRAMRAALLLPFWTTGVIPALLGLYWQNGVLYILAALLIGGAAGDFAMYVQLRKYPQNALVQDDSQEPKLYVYQQLAVDDVDDS